MRIDHDRGITHLPSIPEFTFGAALFFEHAPIKTAAARKKAKCSRRIYYLVNDHALAPAIGSATPRPGLGLWSWDHLDSGRVAGCPAAPCVRPSWARTKWGSSPLLKSEHRRTKETATDENNYPRPTAGGRPNVGRKARGKPPTDEQEPHARPTGRGELASAAALRAMAGQATQRNPLIQLWR